MTDEVTRPDPQRPDASRIELSGLKGHLENAKKTEEAWRLLMESVKDFAILLLDPDGRFASWNEGAERLLGYGANEILGAPFRQIFIPEDVEKGLPEDELRRAAAEGRATDDNWLLRKDGSRFWASGVTTPLCDDAGRLIGFAKVVRDLTERKRFEDELTQAKAMLEERVRERTSELREALQELGAFAYSVAHDLRAPLRAMTSLSDLVVADYADRLDESGRDYLGRISQAARKMDRLIQDLLEYSRLTRAEIHLGPVDLDAVADEVLKELSGEIRERRAALSVERPLGWVFGNELPLRHVILNLLSNALKFVPEGIDPEIRIWTEPRGKHVRLWIEDKGIGIPAEHQQRIFGLFERLHPDEAFPGTGIGLAIVRRAMERLKGKAGVESAPGQGSRFWVELRTGPTRNQ